MQMKFTEEQLNKMDKSLLVQMFLNNARAVRYTYKGNTYTK